MSHQWSFMQILSHTHSSRGTIPIIPVFPHCHISIPDSYPPIFHPSLHAHHPSYPTHHHLFLSLYPTTHLTNHILYLPIPINMSTIHFYSHTSSKLAITPLTISIFSPPYLHLLIPISYTIHGHPPYLPRIPIFQMPMRPISLTNTHLSSFPPFLTCMKSHA